MADHRVHQSINYLTEGTRDMETRNYSPQEMLGGRPGSLSGAFNSHFSLKLAVGN